MNVVVLILQASQLVALVIVARRLSSVDYHLWRMSRHENKPNQTKG